MLLTRSRFLFILCPACRPNITLNFFTRGLRCLPTNCGCIVENQPLKIPIKHLPWWRRLSSSSSEDVFKTSSKRLNQDEYIRLSYMSSEDVFKTSWSRPIYSSWPYGLQEVLQKRLQDIFKTSSRLKMSSRHLQDVLSRRHQDVFKTSSRRLAKAS